MTEKRIGGVTARFNGDGTLYIYQPDSNRVLSSELAGDLVDWLVLNYGPMQTAADEEWRVPDAMAKLEARSSIERGVADVEAGKVKPLPAMTEPTLKQLRAQATAMGVSPAGSKAQITARLAKKQG